MFQLTDSAHKASHYMWRDHWRWWLWHASGKKSYKDCTFVERRHDCVLFRDLNLQKLLFLEGSVGQAHPLFPLLKSVTVSPHCGVLHPECLLLLKRPLREPVTCQRECVLGLGSRLLALFCSLCRACFLCTVRMARSGFHLLFASTCHKLTVDVHTWPAMGHAVAPIDGCSAGAGVRLRHWQLVKADFGGWLAVPVLSDHFGQICSQAAHPFVASF